MKLITFGNDLLKILGIVTEVAAASEPIVDLTQPGVAQVYNLSVQEGLNVLAAFMGQAQSVQTAPPAPVQVAPAKVEAPAAPVADPAPVKVEAPAAPPAVVHGPGLAATVRP